MDCGIGDWNPGAKAPVREGSRSSLPLQELEEPILQLGTFGEELHFSLLTRAGVDSCKGSQSGAHQACPLALSGQRENDDLRPG